MEERAVAEVELYCLNCLSQFAASPDTPGDKIVDRMRDEGPWYTLANGATFEEMIWSALLYRGAIRCPNCARPVVIREKSLGQLIDMLAKAEGEQRLSAKRLQKSGPRQRS